MQHQNIKRKKAIIKAKENKIFRNGTIDNLVVVGIDGTGIDVIVEDAIYLEEKFLKIPD